MRRRIFIIIAAAATMVAFTAPGLASADGFGQFCDSNDLCMAMDGTALNLVFGKLISTTSTRQMSAVTGSFSCTHNGMLSKYVQAVDFGDSENCPFASKAWDDRYWGDEIVLLSNAFYNLYAQAKTSTGEIYQSPSNGNGLQWIKVVNPTGAYVNVLATDNRNHVEYLCDNGLNQPLIISISSTGCSWSI